MLDKILAIIIFIIAFAALICIHEAGHLSMAKLFKVYCKEYSIGFGPAIYSKKKKGHETTFSVRWVPLGGYVSMYGEEDTEDDPVFKDIPVERSLEGVKKWKKAIIVSAGVILNAILALVLIFISNFAFKPTIQTREAIVKEGSLLYEAGLRSDDRVIFPTYGDDEKRVFSYEYVGEKKKIHANAFFVVDNTVQDDEGNHYVLTFYYDSNKTPEFTNGIKIYPGISRENIENSPKTELLFKEWITYENEHEGEKTNYFPDIEKDDFVFEKDVVLKDVSLSFVRGEEEPSKIVFDLSVSANKKTKKYSNSYGDLGLAFRSYKSNEKIPFNVKLRNTFVDYGNASIAVFKGLKTLFTGGITNMSGVVGILDASTTYFAKYTLAYYFYFWGLISVNLAIFNLLPFPGLDGWQLLVTCVEGISHKKLPNKFKTVMSLIGLALLLGLMIVILVLDVLRILGI